MLRFGLLLLVATSSLAAPSYPFENVLVDLVGLDKIGPTKNIGRANHITDGLITMFDGGELNIYTVTLGNMVNEMASLKDRNAQALALAQAITGSMTLATGIPGDVCIAKDVINKYASGSNYRQAVKDYITIVAKNLKLLVKMQSNKKAARFDAGPRIGCSDGGRIYDFENAWNSIIAKSPPSASGLINEEYCTVRRLYNAFDVRSNNMAAAITATSLPPVADIFIRTYGPLSGFVNALIGNRNVDRALVIARDALLASV